jgi:hypothetical protein
MLDSEHLPARLCSNGHYVCASPCLPQLFESQSVLFEYDINTHMPIVHIADDSISIKCPSCKVLVYLSDVKEMSDTFIYQCIWNKPSSCPYDGCSKLFSGRAFVRHVLTCDWRTHVCMHCCKDVRVDNLELHVAEECIALTCRFCRENVIGYNVESLRAHLRIHNRHEDIRRSLLFNLDRVRGIINRSEGFGALRTNNVHVEYSVLQEALHFNEALSRFISHGEAQTYSSFWRPGELQNDEDLIQRVPRMAEIDDLGQESDGNFVVCILFCNSLFVFCADEFNNADVVSD